MTRSHLEYAVSVWNPHHQSLIEKLEKLQKRATKLVLTVKKLCYQSINHLFVSDQWSISKKKKRNR